MRNTIEELAREDQALEQKQDSAMLALMEHRWKAVNEHGYSGREYARALGHKGGSTVRRYVKAWELWLELGDPVDGVSPLDVLGLADMGPARREAAMIVASAHGLRISALRRKPGRDEHLEEVRRVHADIDAGQELLESEGHEPAEARRLAADEVRVRMTQVEAPAPEPSAHAVLRELNLLGLANNGLEESLRRLAGLELDAKQTAQVQRGLARTQEIAASFAQAFAPLDEGALSDLTGEA